MLVDQQTSYPYQACPKNPAERQLGKPKCHSHSDPPHGQMEDFRDVQGASQAEFGRDAVESGLTVKFEVLASVDDIEAGHPKHDHQSECDGGVEIGNVGLDIGSPDGNPRADRGEHESDPQPKMDQPGKSLSNAVTHQENQHRDAPLDRNAVGQEQQGRRDEKSCTADREPDHFGSREQLCREVPFGSAWVFTVKFFIEETVHGHCEASSGHHACQDPSEIGPSEGGW